jgi:hypothetical protein
MPSYGNRPNSSAVSNPSTTVAMTATFPDLDYHRAAPS